MVSQALEGLRVIDMATVFAGPGAARHLADFGADVVKVESPTGDGVRRIAIPAAMEWTEKTRGMFAGLYRDYALGAQNDRCFTQLW